MKKSLNCGMIGIEIDSLKQIELAGTYLFDSVDLSLKGLADVEALLGKLTETGVQPGNMSDLLPGKVSVSQKEWDEKVLQLPASLEMARKLGFKETTMVVMPFDEKLNFQACMDLHVSRLKEIAPRFADAHMRIGLEYVSPQTRRAGYPHEFIYNLEGMLELIGNTNEKNIGILLDSFHWFCAGESVKDIEALSSDQIVVVHVNDALKGRDLTQQSAFERELPGMTGEIDINGFIGALKRIGFCGPVSAEPMNREFNGLVTEAKLYQLSQVMDKILTL